MKKVFIKANLTLISPAVLSCGKGDISDSTVIRDSSGKPFIAGSTIAGLCRHFMEKTDLADRIDDIFGKTGTKNNNKKSKIVFFDMPLKESFSVSVRDGVHLDKNRVTVKTGKFDYEVVDVGAQFVFRMELSADDGISDIAHRMINMLISAVNNKEIRFAAKKNRGFGEAELSEVAYLEIDPAVDFEALLNFSWDNVKEKYKIEKTDTILYDTLEIPFNVSSYLLIGNSSGLTKRNDTNKYIEKEQLKSKGNAVIPGTSWAGAFRHHMVEIAEKAGVEFDVNSLFGYCEGNTARASSITFSESVISGNTNLQRTRCAVDRFTGGACNKKLFTSSASFGGTGKLVIRVLKKDCTKLVKSLIERCIDDYNDGSLTIGSEMSIGGGRLKFEKNGGDLNWL